MSVFQLVYTSAARKDINAEQIRSLLQSSRHNNQKSGITGMLVYGHRHFIQLLEGQQDNVMHLYQNICADQRHDRVVLQLTRLGRNRFFNNWDMGYQFLDVTKPLDLQRDVSETSSAAVRYFVKKCDEYLDSLNFEQKSLTCPV